MNMFRKADSYLPAFYISYLKTPPFRLHIAGERREEVLRSERGLWLDPFEGLKAS